MLMIDTNFIVTDEKEIDFLCEHAANDDRIFCEANSTRNLQLSTLISSATNSLQSRAHESIKEGNNFEKKEEKEYVATLVGRLISTSHVICKDFDDSSGTLDRYRHDSLLCTLNSNRIQTTLAHVRPPILDGINKTKNFQVFKHRYANAQLHRTLLFPGLPQPASDIDLDEVGKTEMTRTRPSHRFIITADTQFGILMDGFAMEDPNWNIEIDISVQCVQKINSMEGDERPLFVCVCGDLVDTEESFSNALAYWKSAMKKCERKYFFEQQIKDWKEVWSHLDKDIGLVCLCGNHDVGNRPTASSIQKWTSEFGSDYLAFWVNGTYNIGLNNCLFSDPSGAMNLLEEQLKWLEERLEYASCRQASQIFVYSHYPWFINHEDEENVAIKSASFPPDGWGPKGMQFSNNYFSIPLENRKYVLSLFRKYNVKACFSGHFHQNVVSKSSWGMDMITTAPLSMMLKSSSRLSIVEEEQTIGLRVVDVSENTFRHKFIPLDLKYCKECESVEKE